jgi:hypothetical protein
MNLPRPSLVVAFGLLIACGGDGGGDVSGEGTTTGTSTSTGDSTTTAGMTTTGPGSTESTGVETTTADTSGSETTGTEESSTTSDTETAGFDCAMTPAGPFPAERILMDVPFQTFAEGGAEDLAFDGQGHIAARGQGDTYLLVSADGTYEEFATDDDPTYGMRFLSNGDLVAAAYQASDILRITPSGEISTFAQNVGGVNGIFPDSAGGVWYTNFAQVGYVTAEGNVVTVIGSASSANGVFFDEARQTVFFTNYQSGALRKAEIVDGLAQAPVDLGEIPGAPDGITLDVCGNLYVNDQGNSDMYRLFLDDAAMPLGEPELLVEGGFPTNVANAQFGSGEGWEATSLYAIGVGGGLYRVDVGVPGAPYVTVE